jgi:hypothetical protein
LIAVRHLAIVSGGFATVATLLTDVGLYGIVAFTMARRTREIGLRLAPGATPGSVITLVLRESLLLVLIGAGLGLPAAMAAASLLKTRLRSRSFRSVGDRHRRGSDDGTCPDRRILAGPSCLDDSAHGGLAL